MNFNKTSAEVQNELLKEIDDSYEKRKGCWLWDLTKAFAINIKSFLEKLTNVSNKLDVNNLQGDELEQFINQRTGITRKKETYATGILTIVGNGEIKQGDIFETEGLVRFVSVESMQITEKGNVKIQAVNSGSSGNVVAGGIKKIPITIQGIINCYNENETSGGYEAENDNDLRQRYFERLRTPATSGNIYHYKQWAKEVEGVGDARVVPLWNGNNTVKVIIINSDRLPADENLVDKVQNYIDPGITGTGGGVAPIGAFCTVESASGKTISIYCKLQIANGYKLGEVLEDIKREISNYFYSIAFVNDIVSYAIIGARILNVEGVLDYKDLKINNSISNIECANNEVFTLGDVTIV